MAKFLGHSPDTALDEDLRRIKLHLVDQGASPITLNATIMGLKFLSDITLGRPEAMAKMQSVRVPQTLPVILSKEEVTRLIACVGHIKHQTALSLAYGTGLRVGEVVALKIGDIDGQRMTLRVEQSKGRKDRYAMLSPVLLERLQSTYMTTPLFTPTADGQAYAIAPVALRWHCANQARLEAGSIRRKEQQFSKARTGYISASCVTDEQHNEARRKERAARRVLAEACAKSLEIFTLDVAATEPATLFLPSGQTVQS